MFFIKKSVSLRLPQLKHIFPDRESTTQVLARLCIYLKLSLPPFTPRINLTSLLFQSCYMEGRKRFRPKHQVQHPYKAFMPCRDGSMPFYNRYVVYLVSGSCGLERVKGFQVKVEDLAHEYLPHQIFIAGKNTFILQLLPQKTFTVGNKGTKCPWI